MKAQIDINGNVAIIHSVQSNTVKERVAVDTGESTCVMLFVMHSLSV